MIIESLGMGCGYEPRIDGRRERGKRTGLEEGFDERFQFLRIVGSSGLKSGRHDLVWGERGGVEEKRD